MHLPLHAPLHPTPHPPVAGVAAQPGGVALQAVKEPAAPTGGARGTGTLTYARRGAAGAYSMLPVAHSEDAGAAQEAGAGPTPLHDT